ncbi:MAG: alpha/beta fold hydrolase [Myxococcales bacterium]|nr:alpha/beta fold hydrolase [Myxococcales bacterium]
MVRSQVVPTPRLAVHCLVAGEEDSPVVVLVHGNVSSAAFWHPLIEELAQRYRVIAPDLRGYGETEPAPIDATRGVRDFSDDLHALLTTMQVRGPVHLLGWSVGGAVVMQYAIDHAGEVASLVLENPMAPYGFGGTKDLRGTPCSPDFAGSGGGTANPEFVRLLKAGERGVDSQVAPRNVMRGCYFHAANQVDAEREDAYVGAMLTTVCDDDHYPGDMTASSNWPGVAPGTRGMNNALSPKYVDLSGFAAIDPRPPVLWIRGADDVIVSDTSLFDFGFLGRLGAVPGWPGEEVCPPQPMIGQTRAVLEAYARSGGRFEELVLPACGHSPHIEKQAEFVAALDRFIVGR